MSSKLMIAGAGAGKTTWLVNKALKIKNSRVLITTFTEANEQGIKEKIYEINGCIPANITVMTWFSFLLRHGVRPYQSAIYDGDIAGMLLVNKKSGYRFTNSQGRPIYYGEKDTVPFYLSRSSKIYSDKIAKFVVRANEKTNGLVLNRISRIFSNIFIDEVQDLAGYDLEIIKLLENKHISLLMVGDPRQVTYHTHDELKNKKYNDGNIAGFITDHCRGIEIDEKTLNKSYRNNQLICDFANTIYPQYSPCESFGRTSTGHDGVFLVSTNMVDQYIEEYHPVLLRDKSTVKVSNNGVALNFGDSKGLTFDRVLIYPTKPMQDWIKNANSKLEPKSRARLYVAITRAKYSVAFINDDIDATERTDIYRWMGNQ
jgi:DNA helicase-2/ATP-dependent DNA helicase PcrA